MAGFIKRNWAILLVTAIALLLRVWGIQFGKPFRYHPDEIKLVAQAGRLLDISQWNKDVFYAIGVYPPLITYIYALAFGLYSAIGLIIGVYPSIDAVREAYYTNPFQFHLLGRWISALMGTASVPLLFIIGTRLYGKKVGLFAASLLMVSYLHVRNSHFATVDVPATLLALATFMFAINIFQNDGLRHYLFAGISAGLAIAMKYNLGLIILPVILAHVLNVLQTNNHSINSWIGVKPVSAAISCIAAFLVACPLPLLNFTEFRQGIIGTAQFESVGKLGSGGNFWSYLTGHQSEGFGFFADNSFTASVGFLITILIAIGVIFLLFRHKQQDLLILIFPLVSFVFFSTMNYKAMRHLLPTVPFFLLVVAFVITMVWTRIKNRKMLALVTIFTILVILEPLTASLRNDIWLTFKDPRTEAKEWIEATLPEGTKIGIERFGPPLLSMHDTTRDRKQMSGLFKNSFNVYGTLPKMYVSGNNLSDSYNASDHVRENDIDYIVLDSFTRATFEWPLSRKRYPELTEQRQSFYQWIEINCTLLKRFNPPNGSTIFPTIEVYRLPALKVDP